MQNLQFHCWHLILPPLSSSLENNAEIFVMKTSLTSTLYSLRVIFNQFTSETRMSAWNMSGVRFAEMENSELICSRSLPTGTCHSTQDSWLHFFTHRNHISSLSSLLQSTNPLTTTEIWSNFPTSPQIKLKAFVVSCNQIDNHKHALCDQEYHSSL